MKILTACQAGIARSAAMSRALKKFGHDVLVAGLGYNDASTIEMLGNWADRIVVMQKELVPLVPEQFLGKVVLADIGPDVWGGPDHPDLRKRVTVIAEAWAKEGYQTNGYSLRPGRRPSKVR